MHSKPLFYNLQKGCMLTCHILCITDFVSLSWVITACAWRKHVGPCRCCEKISTPSQGCGMLSASYAMPFPHANGGTICTHVHNANGHLHGPSYRWVRWAVAHPEIWRKFWVLHVSSPAQRQHQLEEALRLGGIEASWVGVGRTLVQS
jgi:hypothetical protein